MHRVTVPRLQPQMQLQAERQKKQANSIVQTGVTAADSLPSSLM